MSCRLVSVPRPWSSQDTVGSHTEQQMVMDCSVSRHPLGPPLRARSFSWGNTVLSLCPWSFHMASVCVVLSLPLPPSPSVSLPLLCLLSPASLSSYFSEWVIFQALNSPSPRKLPSAFFPSLTQTTGTVHAAQGSVVTSETFSPTGPSRMRSEDGRRRSPGTHAALSLARRFLSIINCC